MELEKIIFVSILLVLILAIGIYFIIRFMKGNIKIQMIKNSFVQAEPITGSFKLKAKKEIDSNRLIAVLIGQEKITTNNFDNNNRNRRRTRYEEIYRFEQTIESQKHYSAGFSNQYSFSLPFPSSNVQRNQNTALNIASNLFLGRTKSTVWKVEVRLDAQGVDLSSSKRIYLNFNQNKNQSQQKIQN